MQDAGSKGFNDICKFYCDYKSKLDAGFTTASLVLSNADLASLVTQYKLDAFIFHGVPITTFLVLAIKWGILDEFCDCENC
jgi:hypothetical protein